MSLFLLTFCIACKSATLTDIDMFTLEVNVLSLSYYFGSVNEEVDDVVFKTLMTTMTLFVIDVVKAGSVGLRRGVVHNLFRPWATKQFL